MWVEWDQAIFAIVEVKFQNGEFEHKGNRKPQRGGSGMDKEID